MGLTTDQVKAEITKRLKASKQGLTDLGGKRQTPTEQYQYLIEISMKYQRIVADALASNYGRFKVFQDNSTLRLVTATVNRSETMATMFAENGHTYRFEGSLRNEANSAGDADLHMGINSVEEIMRQMSATNDDEGSGKSSGPTRTIPVRQLLDHTGISDQLPDTEEVSQPLRDGILDWLRTIYRESRGFEIGTVNPSLLAIIMKEQSRKWEHIALGYVADIIVLTHSFVNKLLDEVCPTRRVREGIRSLLGEELSVRYKAAIKHVEFLLDVELNGTPSTLNHYFNDNLQKGYVRVLYLQKNRNLNN